MREVDRKMNRCYYLIKRNGKSKNAFIKQRRKGMIVAVIVLFIAAFLLDAISEWL